MSNEQNQLEISWIKTESDNNIHHSLLQHAAFDINRWIFASIRACRIFLCQLQSSMMEEYLATLELHVLSAHP